METIQQIKEIVDAIGGIGPALGSVIILGFVLIKLIEMFGKFNDNLKESNRIAQELRTKMDIDIEVSKAILDKLDKIRKKRK